MILIDNALKSRAAAGRPVRLGMVGAGFMARGIANQIVNSVPGMQLAAIACRNAGRACEAYAFANVEDAVEVNTESELADAIAANRPAYTEDPLLLCRAPGIDAVLEVTGSIEYAARVVLEAIFHGKHVVLMNAELDGTVGPILKTYADRANVIYSGCDGDQPGVELNLYRMVRGLGMEPLLLGNIKGLHDPYRNPTTQEAFAKRWGQNPRMVTSFADGTKISFEQAIVANATGMSVARRGMLGGAHDGHVDSLTERFDPDELRSMGGIVDYVVGARPGPGVYCLAAHHDSHQRHYLELYKLGKGPLYSFYTPYHLCHFEAPLSVARAVLFNDAVIAPAGPPMVDVVATAKVDLKAGQTLDEIGGYLTYGLAENYPTSMREGLLPIGLAAGCVLQRDVPQDQVLSYADVAVPSGRLIDKLRQEQDARFAPSAPPTRMAAANPQPAQ
jgi:predicted homoserine dehydrogenase-like protein